MSKTITSKIYPGLTAEIISLIENGTARVRITNRAGHAYLRNGEELIIKMSSWI